MAMRGLWALGACALAAAGKSKPNIVLVLTDDQDVEMGSLDYMPKLRQLIGEEGTTFEHMYAAVPVCCPSRSVLLSGQYQHNNGAIGNIVKTGCNSPGWQQGPERRSFATYLHEAGYATSFAGKYLNTYGDAEAGGVEHIPPGWTNWQGLAGNSRYYSYILSNNGVAEKHGEDYATDYLPDLILNRTLDFLDRHADQPFFAFLSTPSCHDPTDAAPQHADLYPEVAVPRTPAFGAKVDHVHWFQEAQAAYGLDNNSIAYIDLKYRRRLQTLATVDDMVEAVVQKLKDLDQLEDTYFIYTSDNGYHLGHYGVVYDKRQPWRTDAHLPLLVRGPGIHRNKTSNALVTMPDLSATILDMAGLPVPEHFDGVSLLPGMRPGAAASGRHMTLIEYHGEANGGGPDDVCPLTSGDSGMFCLPAANFTKPPLWHGKPVCACQDSLNNTYNCLLGLNESAYFRYCEFADTEGTVEYFDFVADPHELQNQAAALDPTLRTALHNRLARAVACKGAEECEAALAAPLIHDEITVLA